MEMIKYRHNIMAINSIKAFAGIKGTLDNNVRDVYFIRAVGESFDLDDIILEMDRIMDEGMANNSLSYLRIDLLPQLKDVVDSEFYSELYDKWKNDETCEFRHIKSNALLGRTIGKALQCVLEIYKKTKMNMTPTMEKNIVVKLLYWIDSVTGCVFDKWTENADIKVVADNVIKEHEYLFYLLLTFVGCNVLLIQNRKDISLEGDILGYSYDLILGEFGETKIKPYKKGAAAKSETTKSEDANQSIAGADNRINRVVIPERRNRRKPITVQIQNSVQTQNSMQTQNNSNYMQTPGIVMGQSEREKTFEELAQLASSVVLIAVHDSNGQVLGTGSGIMIGRSGYILTNNHVAAGGIYYSVRIEDDDNVYNTSEVIKYNQDTDLAVIRINRNLNPIPIYNGRKKLVRGQKVVAIGSPLGLFNSVSDGIISGFRKIDDVDMIQFTAPISNGSSGGAVLNMQGEVIGISTAGFDRGQNINLAVGYENIRMFAGGFIGK